LIGIKVYIFAGMNRCIVTINEKLNPDAKQGYLIAGRWIILKIQGDKEVIDNAKISQQNGRYY
jgi:hypothetical protein